MKKVWCTVDFLVCVICKSSFPAKAFYWEKIVETCTPSCRQKLAYLNIKDKVTRNKKVALAKIGDKNPNWNGGKKVKRYIPHPRPLKENVDVDSLHAWLHRKITKPLFCGKCKKNPPYDLANISPTYSPLTYTRNIDNWRWLCRRCHMKEDGRLEKMIQRNKTKTS